MCYLPKATFYLYFGFFFVGYVWIFGLLFYRTMYNDVQQLEKIKDQRERQLRGGDKLSQNESSYVTKPQLPYTLYDLQQPIEQSQNDESSSLCLDLVETKPSFTLCIHDPKVDRGLSAYVNLHKTWEPDVTSALITLLKKFVNDTFVDVGANVGYFSILAAKLGANVIAVEPFLDNLLLLHRSAHLNDVQNRITVIKNALGDKRDIVKFVDTSDNNVGGRFYLDFDEPKHDSSAKLNTSMIFMDDLLGLDVFHEPTGRNVILKFDVQGRECFILDKAGHFFDSLNVRAVFMEWSDARTLRNELCNRRMVKFFKSRRFKPVSFEGADISNRFDFRQERLNMLPNFMWLPISSN